MMKLDPHIHSIYSKDSQSKPKDILKQAKKVGLDIIAISDHNTNKGSKIAIEMSKSIEGIDVIPSIEISSNKGHIIGFGIEELISTNLSPEETIDKIHDLGGVAIIPHPYSIYRNGLLTKINYKTIEFDGIEVLNARFILGFSNTKSKKLAKKNNIPEFGSSDSHFLDSIGDCYTKVDIESIDDLFDAIKKNRTKAFGKRTSNYLITKEVFNKKIRRKY
ncbi:MAG: PHP domain-containing protein [Methanobrevibacter sp.]|nr:PHP domain-containing protein [Candidatus Methanovirga australis]